MIVNFVRLLSFPSHSAEAASSSTACDRNMHSNLSLTITLTVNFDLWPRPTNMT